MTNEASFSQWASEQRRLYDQGILCCDITEEDVTVARVFDDRAERLICTTTGQRLRVSVPDGLRSACFRMNLPQQSAVASIVVRDIDALAARVGPGDPAKGIGIAANQSATLTSKMKQIAARGLAGQPVLDASQCEASMEEGGVPAFFRYQDPDGNVIRMFNPVDSTAWNSDGPCATETDVRSEGCLSSFEFRGQVLRPITMIVDGQDIEGKIFRITARGPAARLLGHEVSHVNGGIDGLCIVQGGLPVFTFDEYEKLEPEARDWLYLIDFETVPYLELHDPAGELDPASLRTRLANQGLLTLAGPPTAPQH